jgi:hypothetical protein
MVLPPATIAPAFAVGFGPHIDRGRKFALRYIRSTAGSPAALWRSGQARVVGLPGLLIAAVAERERVTVLRYDSDYDLIAAVTGQPLQWVVPRGTIP